MAGSRWVKIDTGYLRNPKVRALGPSGTLVHLSSILFCADQLTDGEVPRTALGHVVGDAYSSPRWAASKADQLVDVGLWVPTEYGWHVHDFERMNPQAMRHIVEAQRKAWRERQADHRAGETDDVTP